MRKTGEEQTYSVYKEEFLGRKEAFSKAISFLGSPLDRNT